MRSTPVPWAIRSDQVRAREFFVDDDDHDDEDHVDGGTRWRTIFRRGKSSRTSGRSVGPIGARPGVRRLGVREFSLSPSHSLFLCLSLSPAWRVENKRSFEISTLSVRRPRRTDELSFTLVGSSSDAPKPSYRYSPRADSCVRTEQQGYSRRFFSARYTREERDAISHGKDLLPCTAPLSAGDRGVGRARRGAAGKISISLHQRSPRHQLGSPILALSKPRITLSTSLHDEPRAMLLDGRITGSREG